MDPPNSPPLAVSHGLSHSSCLGHGSFSHDLSELAAVGSWRARSLETAELRSGSLPFDGPSSFLMANLLAMASNLLSNGLQPKSDGLQPKSDGWPPT